MRRMILTSLVLLPVMARAQADTTTEAKPYTSSAMQAELTQPAIGAKLAIEAATTKAATPAASIAAIGSANHAAIHEFIQTKMIENFADAGLMKGGTLEYAMMGSVPTQSSAPQVTRAVEVTLTPAELAEQPAVTNVVVHAIVDVNGIPRNVAVTQSGGSVIDRKVVEAISQYRFVPAKTDNKATWSTVSISVKIQKP
jgi:hypothetical protein